MGEVGGIISLRRRNGERVVSGLQKIKSSDKGAEKGQMNGEKWDFLIVFANYRKQ